MTKLTIAEESKIKKYIVRVLSTILLVKIAEAEFDNFEEMEAYIQKRRKTDYHAKYYVSYNWGLCFEAY
jgi:hypothetical protein